jgi:hypothetical protein
MIPSVRPRSISAVIRFSSATRDRDGVRESRLLNRPLSSQLSLAARYRRVSSKKIIFGSAVAISILLSRHQCVTS